MIGGIMFRQREIVLIPFPNSDLTGSKLRPALIISNENLFGNDKICCLITSNPSAEQDSISIGKNDFEKGSLQFKSWVKSYRLFTINEKIIRKRLCLVKTSFHKKIIHSINSYVN
jgi:mRNA interferase MazF